jgi:hypothetical protein
MCRLHLSKLPAFNSYIYVDACALECLHLDAHTSIQREILRCGEKNYTVNMYLKIICKSPPKAI